MDPADEAILRLLVEYGGIAAKELGRRAKGGPLYAGLARVQRLGERAAQGALREAGRDALVYTLGQVQGTLVTAGVIHWLEVSKHIREGHAHQG
jgi:hypothetical protein